jgi:polyhydroxyalkanoate synthesis repressor PhaR
LRVAAKDAHYVALRTHFRAAKRKPNVAEKTPDDDRIVIKKYANRRLYNTATSSYVTLDRLSQMVKDGQDFVVFDARTGDDITRSVLTQIIFEEESRGPNLLPINFLRQLISFYGDSLQGVLPQYLDLSMESFSHNQDSMREQMAKAFGGSFPFATFEDMGRQNMAMFQQAMELFNPFRQGDGGSADAGQGKAAAADPASGGSDDIDDLKKKLESLQSQFDELSRK